MPPETLYAILGSTLIGLVGLMTLGDYFKARRLGRLARRRSNPGRLELFDPDKPGSGQPILTATLTSHGLERLLRDVNAGRFDDRGSP